VKEEFHEDLNSEQLDTLDGKIEQFPYDDIDIPAAARPVFEEKVRELEKFYADREKGFVLRLMQFVIDNKDTMSQQSTGRRFLALAWALDPSLFPGSPSLHALAKRLHMDVSGLSRVAAMATKEFGIKNRAQAHGDGVRK
jgi:hypothetical protein